MKDYYRILGVPENATSLRIRGAFLEKKILSLTEDDMEAWSVLSSTEQRRAYDAKRSALCAPKQPAAAPMKAPPQQQVSGPAPTAFYDNMPCKRCGRLLPEWWQDILYWGKDAHRKQCRDCGRCLIPGGNHFLKRCDPCWRKIRKAKEAVAAKRREAAEQAEAERRAAIERKAEERRDTIRQFKDAEIVTYKAWRKTVERMPRYSIWRQEIFERNGRRCMMCGVADKLEIDHYPVSLYQLWKTYDLSRDDGRSDEVRAYECEALWDARNGKPLCKSCHAQTRTNLYYKQMNG